PAEERSLALQSLAHFAAGQGDWATAQQHIAALAILDAPLAARLRANLVTMPFFRPDAGDVRTARTLLEANPVEDHADAAAADPHHFAQARRTYHLGILSLLAGDPDAMRFADDL